MPVSLFHNVNYVTDHFISESHKIQKIGKQFLWKLNWATLFIGPLIWGLGTQWGSESQTEGRKLAYKIEKLLTTAYFTWWL